MMARAFDDDPIANWFAAQDKRRARRIYDFMDVGYQIVAPGGEMYTTDEIQGGAFWSPPGKWKMGIVQQLKLLPQMIRTASLRRVPGVMAGLNAIEKKHPHEPHYYLLGLGVEPDLQGRGLGTQLMAPILERCDREGVPAYLESSKEKNVPLYERNGFKVTERFQVPNGGPPIWLMWRDPR
jgi:GNAT superfamily N-acetyltransferase